MKQQGKDICVTITKAKSIGVSVPICECGSHEVYCDSLKCTKCGVKSDWFEFELPENREIIINV